jgi:hypothetical protein
VGFLSHKEAPWGPAGGAGRFPATADWLSDYIYCRGAALLVCELEWDAIGVPLGDFYLLGNADDRLPPSGPDASHDFPIPLPAGTAGTYGAWPTVTGVAGNAAIFIANPAPQHKIGFTFVGGGAGNPGFRLAYHLRSG